MQNILYIMFGMPSCYNSGIEFGLRLKNIGYSVRIASDKNLADQMNKVNLDFHHLTLEQRFPSSKTSFFSLIAAGLNLLLKNIPPDSNRSSPRYASLNDKELDNLILEFKPDALIIDIECHLAVISSRKHNIPTALCSRMFDHRYHKLVPPLHSSLKPPNNRLQRLHIRWRWRLLWISNSYFRAKSYASKTRLRSVNHRSFLMPDLKAIADTHKVELEAITTKKDWFRPLTYRDFPILSMNARELDFKKEEREGYHYLGPMIGHSNHAFTISLDNQKIFNQFLIRHENLGKYFVYCAMGTWLKTNDSFVISVLELARLNPELSIVLALGGKSHKSAIENAPDNLCILDSAPQIECLSKADVCLLHGGIASINEAIFNEVPMILCSTGTNDQNGNVARCVHHKLALKFDINRLNPHKLNASIYSLLTDDALKKNLTIYRNTFQNYTQDNLLQTMESLSSNTLTASSKP